MIKTERRLKAPVRKALDTIEMIATASFWIYAAIRVFFFVIGIDL